MISSKLVLRQQRQCALRCAKDLHKIRRHTNAANLAAISNSNSDGGSKHTTMSSIAAISFFMTAMAATSLEVKDDIEQVRVHCQSETNTSRFKMPRAKGTQRNVTVHRMRSLRARNMAEKYNVDWKQVLGEGAYGSVHPARLAATGEKVALKKISKRYTDTSSFQRETDALLRIYNNGGHPNISGLRDMYEDYDHYYLVMDLVSGGEMFDHLIEYGAYSEADAARLMREVTSALAFLHGVGVVHADLKPENLLLCSKKRVNGTIKMIDFGCAHVSRDNYHNHDLSDEDKDDSHDDNEMRPKKKSWKELDKDNASNGNEEKTPSTGTTAYWPPERFLNGSMPDPSADMWAVGIILFIMLTGVHPFDLTGVATDAQIEDQIKKDPSPPITPELTSHLSPSAIDLVKKLFEKDPKDRITADELLQHPWITGDEAATDPMEESAAKLSKFRELRAIIEAGVFSILIEQGNRDMDLTEYKPHVVYRDIKGLDKGAREASENKASSPATSVLKKAFEAFDEDGKGFITANDLGRVVNRTGQELSESDRKEMQEAAVTKGEESDVGLTLSGFSKVCAGLKHKHFPRGHVIFRAGDEGDAMYFINSGKVEIQTKKGQLVHILRHGDFFGEGSLLEENNRRFSSARCATPVDVIKIKKSDFLRYTKSSKSAFDTLKFKWKARSLGDAKAMIRLQTNVKRKVLKKGEIVYNEGDMGKSMFFVDEENGGELDVKHGDVVVHRYTSGESFGESSLLLERPRSSTVTCTSDACVLHEMMGSDFFDFLDKSPDTRKMLENMSRKRLFKKAIKAHSLRNKRGFSNDDLTKAFEEVDEDKNGNLSLDEIRKLMHAMDPTIKEKDIVELLKFIDVDDDGKLSFEDFKRIFRQFEHTAYLMRP